MSTRMMMVEALIQLCHTRAFISSYIYVMRDGYHNKGYVSVAARAKYVVVLDRALNDNKVS
jgi:hypothetical protein